MLCLGAVLDIHQELPWGDLAFFIFLVIGSLSIIGSGIYYLLYLFSWKLSITQTAIEIRYLRSYKVYYLRDILYYKYEMGALHLETFNSKDSITISLFTKKLHRINFFCYHKLFLDPDQADELNTIVHNDKYGIYIADRLKTLVHFTKANRIFHVIILFIAVVNFFSIGSFPFFFFTTACIPPFVIWWISYSKGMVHLSDEKSIQPAAIILFVVGVISLLVSCHFAFFAENNLYFLLLGLVPAYLFHRFILSKALIKGYLTKFTFIIITIILPFWTQAILKRLNSTLDFGQSEKTPHIVKTKYFSEAEANLFPTIIFEDNLPNLTSGIVLAYEKYKKIQPQDTIYLPVYKGAFGVSWSRDIYLGSSAHEISIHPKSSRNNTP
jgi:hypothetical protein